MHTSVFYFCKLFKKTTGVNFTEFVSRTRVEKAKNLLLNPVFGFFSWFVTKLGGTPVDWLSAHPMGTIIAMVSWEWTPFAMLILLTGLQSLPDDQIEAARLDGANPWQEFRHIVMWRGRPRRLGAGGTWHQDLVGLFGGLLGRFLSGLLDGLVRRHTCSFLAEAWSSGPVADPRVSGGVPPERVRAFRLR